MTNKSSYFLPSKFWILVWILSNDFTICNAAAICTTGSVENKLSHGKYICCTDICENKKSPKYSLKFCCNSTCIKSFPMLCPSTITDIPSTKISLSVVSKSVTSATTSVQSSVTTVTEQTVSNDKSIQNQNEFSTHIHSTLLSSLTSTLLSSSTEILSTSTKSAVKSKSLLIAITCIVLGFMVLFMIAVILYFAWFRKKRVVHMQLQAENCELLLYEINEKGPKYENMPTEVDPEQVVVREKIGNGCFGQVLKATMYRNINEPTDNGKVVALKTPGGNDPFSIDEDVLCLRMELRILQYIGQHVNVVTLIGAISKQSAIGEFVIVTEYCHFSDLRTYIFDRKRIHEIVSLKKQSTNELKSILERNVLCFSALLMYALQIANGAHFLTTKKTIIHRDMALRNMLLTKDHIVKIGDFGLAVNESAYQVKTRKLLPTRWLAPESLNLNGFTAKSDVWSFAVILWEIFSLADNPLKVDAPKDREQFHEWLVSGNRFNPPIYASPPISHLITNCWQLDPNSRPTFLHCRTVIENILKSYSDNVHGYIAQKIGLNMP